MQGFHRRQRVLALLLVVALAVVAGGLWWAQQSPAPGALAPTSTTPLPVASSPEVDASLQLLRAQLDAHRKIIVLLADEASLSAEDRAAANRVGQQLFHEQLSRQGQLDAALERLTAVGAGRDAAVSQVLDYIESGAGLFDADRLAFQEALRALQRGIARDGSLPAVKLHKRVSEDLDALKEIEHAYDREIRQIFSRFESRAIELKREKWADYVAHLKTLYHREQILKDHGIVLPYPPEPPASAPVAAPASADEGREIFGHTLPPRTVVLTFDDGPHPRYTQEVEALLKQYNAPAVFFQVGRNLGQVADGKPKLERGAQIAAELHQHGFTLANHSYSHAQLSKQSGDALKSEILNTDLLLKTVSPQRSPLFRFPYGARNAEGLAALREAQLKSVMWNIDSLDWADPVPRSIADRVLREVDKQGRGIILFHDIHERTLKALPLVLERLVAEGYQFAGWNGRGFEVSGKAAPAAPALSAGDGQAWALVVGIDDYAKWPKLQHAVRDARAVSQTLVERFGFAPERVVTLLNQEATRQGILDAFHTRLAHAGVRKNDRIVVFFAGHGATRTLSSGRELGYIVPADAGSGNDALARDAIPMTEIQNIAETLSARHVLFVMDACYSGLGLTRGTPPGSSNFLRDNARRIGRQMLTAGGADQLVADGGPNGHSVFTWTLLQGLGGKADFNGDGLITATELAAYVAPAVSAVSRQTPAFGSLPGSEGGEFVFQLPAEGEFLTAGSAQLSGEAIQLNTQLDAAAAKPAAGAASAVAVTVKDLHGKERVLEAAPAVAVNARQRAQRANDRGLQLYREKRYAEAEAEFTEALKLRPDFALAANNLGFVYFKQGKFAEAARWYDNTLKVDPSRAIAYLNLGDAHSAAGDKDKAAKAYATYLELQPQGPGAAHARQQLAR